MFVAREHQEHKNDQTSIGNENEATTETPLFLDPTASTTASPSSSPPPISMHHMIRNKPFRSMKTIQRGKLIPPQRSTFVRMRLKPKLTKTNFKTTTASPELFESGETKRVPSLETISPPSIIPMTITQNPILSLISEHKMASLDIVNRKPTEQLNQIPSSSDSLNQANISKDNVISSHNLGVALLPETFTELNDLTDVNDKSLLPETIKTLNVNVKLNDPQGKNTKTAINDIELTYNIEDQEVLSSTIRNEYDILPAVSFFGSLSSAEKNMDTNPIQQPQTVLETDVEIFNAEATEIYNGDVITDGPLPDTDIDVVTFKPIVSNVNPDLSTIQSNVLDKDVVTFDSNSEALFNKESMLLQNPKTTIEPPPASNDAVHVHEMVTPQTQEPDLVQTSESILISKGNQVQLGKKGS